MSKRRPREERGSGDEPAAKRVREISNVSEDDSSELAVSQMTPDFNCPADESNEPEPGVIERVSMQNFMCHDRLTVTIGRHVNFIIGKNGSGKSAIMTAVVVGLGGKAMATNRGAALKTFIKTGKHSAEVSVSLCNRGEDAYKHDIYGDTITVDRKLHAEGGGSYRIKNVQGKMVSDKRSELNNILDHFNIQVDNPVSILNQETSKSFLNSKSNKDKYKFFLKATQLEQMKEDYSQANTTKAFSEELIERKKGTLPDLELKVHEWEQKYKALEAVDELKEKVKRLQYEMAWAFVAQKERGLEPLEKELRQEEARAPKYQKKCQDFQEKVDKEMAKYRTLQEEMATMSKEAEAEQENHNATKLEKENNRKLLHSSQKELNAATGELNSAKKDKKQVMDRLTELKSIAENDYSDQKRCREEKIEQLDAAVEALRAQQTTTQQDNDQFHQAVLRAQEQANGLNIEITEGNKSLDQAQRQLRNLESARDNKMKRYGQHMPDLLRRIDEAVKRRQFHQRPRGPLGAHITLQEQAWAPASEMCLKGLLYSFCCNDHHDRDKLEKIWKQTCPNTKMPTVIVSKFKDVVHDVSQHRARSRDFPTLYDLLEVDDAVVANCLIDQRGIENILMFKDVIAAREVMLKNPPMKAKEGFTITGDQVYAAPNFRYYSNKDAKAKVLTANIEEDIKQAQREVQALQREVTERKNTMKQHQATVNSNQQQLKKCQQKLNAIRNKINNHTYELNELRNVEDPAPQEDIATLEEDAAQIDVQIETYQQRVDALTQNYQTVKEKYDEANDAYTQARDKLMTITERTTEFKEKLVKTEKDINDSKYNLKHYQAKKVEHDKKVSDLQKAKQTYEKEIEEDVAKAKIVCEDRINTRRTATNLESEIHQIQKRIVQEEKVRGSREEITRTYHEKMDAYKKIKKEVGQLGNFLKQLDKVMSERKVAYAEFRRMIAVRAKFFFITMLSSRHYNGGLQFNHEREELNLSVQPTNQASMTKDNKSLSGGERSFSTVCFILALWDTIENPFRMLDEFDVFMDMVNRRIAMDLMMQAANKYHTRQFVFLTPLDMSNVNLPSTARIHELKAPERGQATLPFSRKRKQEADEEEEED